MLAQKQEDERIEAGAATVEGVLGKEQARFRHMVDCAKQNILPDTRNRAERAAMLLGKRVHFFDPFRRGWDTGLVLSVHAGHISTGRKNSGPFLIVRSDTQLHATRRDQKHIGMVNPNRAYWIDEEGNPVDSADWVYRQGLPADESDATLES